MDIEQGLLRRPQCPRIHPYCTNVQEGQMFGQRARLKRPCSMSKPSPLLQGLSCRRGQFLDNEHGHSKSSPMSSFVTYDEKDDLSDNPNDDGDVNGPKQS